MYNKRDLNHFVELPSCVESFEYKIKCMIDFSDLYVEVEGQSVIKIILNYELFFVRLQRNLKEYECCKYRMRCK